MSIDPRVDIGHVHLKVSDLDRALDFYSASSASSSCSASATQAAFISAGGYHHHLGLNTWESKGAGPPPRNTTGLYHTAIRYPTARSLADALRRVLDAGIPLDGASDHGVSEAIYLRDPDENGVELYRDRPQEEWPRPETARRRDVHTRRSICAALLAELDDAGGVAATGAKCAPSTTPRKGSYMPKPTKTTTRKPATKRTTRKKTVGRDARAHRDARVLHPPRRGRRPLRELAARRARARSRLTQKRRASFAVGSKTSRPTPALLTA